MLEQLQANLFTALPFIAALICLRAYFGHRWTKKQLEMAKATVLEVKARCKSIESHHVELKQLQANLKKLLSRSNSKCK